MYDDIRAITNHLHFLLHEAEMADEFLGRKTETGVDPACHDLIFLRSSLRDALRYQIEVTVRKLVKAVDRLDRPTTASPEIEQLSEVVARAPSTKEIYDSVATKSQVAAEWAREPNAKVQG